MIVSTPERLLLKLLADMNAQEQRRSQWISCVELASKVWQLQEAGVVIYSVRHEPDVLKALQPDLKSLQRLGFLECNDEGAAELTGAGDLIASGLEYPDWMQGQLKTA